MLRAALVIVLSSLSLPPAALAQQPLPSVTLIATGPNPAAQAVSRQLLTGVQAQLRMLEKVTSRGDVFVAARGELTQPRLFEYMKANDTNASVVLDFVPEQGTNFGFAHMTVTTGATQPTPAVQPNLGRGGGAAAPSGGTSRAISDYLNPGAVKLWVYENFAAFITERVSGGREIRVHLWVYITPKGSAFSVGGSTPVMASDPGRSENEGFRRWVGTRPQGTTTVELSNLPDYEPAQRQILVPNSADRKYEGSIQVALQRKR